MTGSGGATAYAAPPVPVVAWSSRVPDAARRCPSCGVDNPVERELCGSCGVDLFSGGRLPRPARREAPDPPTPDPSTREHHRWVVPLVAVLIGAALLVGGLTWAGFGPLAGAPDVPAAPFDDERYREDAARLPVADVAASDAHPDAPASAMADRDPATAWRSDGPVTAPPGPAPQALATLELGLPAPGWIDRLVLRNGDHRDPDAYEEAARIARIRLVTDAGETVLADLLDLGLEPQELVFPEPLLASELRLEILEVFPGDEQEPIALAEIELVGWTAEGPDVELAEERREAQRARGEAPVGMRGAGQPS